MIATGAEQAREFETDTPVGTGDGDGVTAHASSFRSSRTVAVLWNRMQQ
jgi:hypothetical protein